MPPTNDDRELLQLDSRGRASLIKYIGTRRHYFIDVDPHSRVVTLTPAIAMTQAEYDLARNPELAGQIDQFLDGGGRQPPVPRAEWADRIHELLLTADEPMPTDAVLQAAQNSKIWCNRTGIATLLTQLLLDGRVEEVKPGHFRALKHQHPAEKSGE
jgi:hypothetical protein